MTNNEENTQIINETPAAGSAHKVYDPSTIYAGLKGQDLINVIYGLVSDFGMDLDRTIAYITERGGDAQLVRKAYPKVLAIMQAEKEERAHLKAHIAWGVAAVAAAFLYCFDGAWFCLVIAFGALAFSAAIVWVAQSRRRYEYAIIAALATIFCLVLTIFLRSDYHQESLLFSKISELSEKDTNPKSFSKTCRQHFVRFPDGAHHDEVVGLYIEHFHYNVDTLSAYVPRINDKDRQEEIAYQAASINPEDLAAANYYFTLFPNGKHAAEVSRAYDKAWERHISKVKENCSDCSPKFLEFLDELFAYMKAHHISKICLKPTFTYNFKGFSDYSADVQRFFKENLTSDMSKYVSGKEYFSADSDERLIKAANEALLLVFSDACQITTEDDGKCPVITLACNLHNREMHINGHTLPDIHEFGQTFAQRGGQPTYFSGNTLAVDIEVTTDLHCTIPGSTAAYDAHAISDENESSINCNTLEAAYHYLANKLLKNCIEKCTKGKR